MSGLPSALWHQLLMGDIVLAVALVLLGIALVCWIGRQANRALFGSWTAHIFGFTVNIGAILGMEQAYELARGQIPQNRDAAFVHSYTVLEFEWRHGFFVESRIEHFFLQFGVLMNAVDVFYALGHAVGTIGILIWLYTRRRRHYASIRNLFMVTTGIAFAVFYLYPAAPPRMFPNYGFSDPEQMQHLVQAGGAQLASYTYNPYAAMPSLHVAYALIVGLALITADRRRAIRVLGALYPMAMIATVLISANHWILDVVGAFITVGISYGLIRLAGHMRSYRARHPRWLHQGARNSRTVFPLAAQD
jgi:PAP2 superfamily protein